MKIWASAHLLIVFVLISTLSVKSSETHQDQYLRIYLTIQNADNLEKENDYLGALVNYKIALSGLIKMQNNTDWEIALVHKRIQDCKDVVAQLTSLAAKQLTKHPELAEPAGPDMAPLLDEGFRLKKTHDNWRAFNQFERYATIVELMRAINPQWESPLNTKRLSQAQDEIESLESAEFQ